MGDISNIPPNCEVCGGDEESIKYVLMDCTIAKIFWTEVKKLTSIKLPTLHPHTWTHDLVDPGLSSKECGHHSLWRVVAVDDEE